MIKKLTLFIISIFDYFYQKKIINFLKKKNFIIDIIVDVGAHKGETIKLFLKHFKPKKIISFEASPKNFSKLNKKINRIRQRFPKTKIIIENIGLGEFKKSLQFKQVNESSSSTFAKINFDSNYYKKKKIYLGIKENKDYFKAETIEVIPLASYLIDRNIDTISILKIDTEGYEYEILRGLDNEFSKIKLIFFEHHYENMISKSYTFTDINRLLVSKNFQMIFKSKMPFRKTFEYIYVNKINL
jgi:FkbM family methyltransferase